MRLRVYAKWSAGYSIPNREVLDHVVNWEIDPRNAPGLLIVRREGDLPEIIYVVANLVRWEAVPDE